MFIGGSPEFVKKKTHRMGGAEFRDRWRTFSAAGPPRGRPWSRHHFRAAAEPGQKGTFVPNMPKIEVRQVPSPGSDQTNYLTLCNKQHKIQPVTFLADLFQDQNYPSNENDASGCRKTKRACSRVVRAGPEISKGATTPLCLLKYVEPKAGLVATILNYISYYKWIYKIRQNKANYLA